MQQQQTFSCSKCRQGYPENNPPRRINCSQRHSICQQCLQQTLNAPNQTSIECPIDKEVINIGQRNLDEFPKNRDLLHVLEEIATRNNAKNAGKQSQDHKADIDLMCITCKREICKECKRRGHKGHTIKSLASFNGKVSEKKFPAIQAKCEEIQECQSFKETICSQFQETQCQQIDATVNELCAIFFGKGEKLKEEVFQKTQISFQNDKNLENENVATLQRQSQKLLLDLENSADDQTARGIIFALYDQENIYENIDIEGWKKEQENQVENLRMLLSQYQIKFNQNLQDFLMNEPLGEFRSPSYSPPPEIESESDKSIFFLFNSFKYFFKIKIKDKNKKVLLMMSYQMQDNF